METVGAEFGQIKRDEVPTFVGAVKGNDCWIVTLKGPEKTALESKIYELQFRFPKTYPEDPPKVTVGKKSSTFFTPGTTMDLPILKEDWTPFFKVCNILGNIQSFLIENYSINESEIGGQMDVKNQGNTPTILLQNDQLQKMSAGIERQEQNPLPQETRPSRNEAGYQQQSLRRTIQCITTKCTDLQKLLNETKLTVLKNSYTRQIQDYAQLRNTLWAEYFKLYEARILQQTIKKEPEI